MHRSQTLLQSRAPRKLLGLALLLWCCGTEPSVQDGATANGLAGRYTNIQGNVFDRRCVTDCHEAVNPGAGLILTRDRSWSALVNQRSQELTARYLVIPGDISGSYLMKKVEDVLDFVGDRMPKDAPRLPQNEIDELRLWIRRGAPND